MKALKTVSLTLLFALSLNVVCAQMVRNRAIHFKRHRVTHHHHKK